MRAVNRRRVFQIKSLLQLNKLLLLVLYKKNLDSFLMTHVIISNVELLSPAVT